MSPEFQKRYKTADAYSIIRHLMKHYNEQAAFEGFKVTRLLFISKIEVGASPMQYALQMYNRIKRLEQLAHWMDLELSIDLILARLTIVLHTLCLTMRWFIKYLPYPN